MSRLTQFLILILLSTFAFVEIANAELIRSSGRGSLSRQFTTDYFFVENQDIVRFADLSIGMSQSAFDARFSSGLSKSVGGGGAGISAVPTSGGTTDTNCNGSYDTFTEQDFQDDIDNAQSAAELNDAEAALAALQAGSPCTWQFEEGQDLLTFGAFQWFFDSPLIGNSVQWRILGNGVDERIAGSINEGPAIITPDGTIGFGQVMLDAPAPPLTVGNYQISVSVSMSSLAGEFFFQRNNPGNNSTVEEVSLVQHREINPAWEAWQLAYDDWLMNVLYPWEDNGRIGPMPVFGTPEPDFELVGYRSVTQSDEIRRASRTFVSVWENLSILPSSGVTNPTNPVNSPFTPLFVFLGVIGLWLRSRN